MHLRRSIVSLLAARELLCCVSFKYHAHKFYAVVCEISCLQTRMIRPNISWYIRQSSFIDGIKGYLNQENLVELNLELIVEPVQPRDKGELMIRGAGH